jgi:type IV secretory pathway VirB2 component (pilin)
MDFDRKTILATIAAAFVMSIMPDLAHALPSIGGTAGGVSFFAGGQAGGIGSALCEIAGWFQGDVGSAIASLAVIFLGISAFFGKTTWGMALMFAVGIFAIFGSGEIVGAITGRGGCCGGITVSIGSASLSACR